jgi:hypothetical protein
MSLSVIIIRMHGDCHFLGLPYAQHSQFVVSHSVISQVKLQVCIYFFFSHTHKMWMVCHQFIPQKIY